MYREAVANLYTKTGNEKMTKPTSTQVSAPPPPPPPLEPPFTTKYYSLRMCLCVENTPKECLRLTKTRTCSYLNLIIISLHVIEKHRTSES